jgi:sulfate adenylyltransferase
MNGKAMIIEEGKYANYPQQPHGGKLVDLVLKGEELEDALKRAAELPAIMVDMEAVITIEMIATGVLSPNKGFMDEANYKSVLNKGRLVNNLVWPVPLSFAPTGDRNKLVLESLAVGDEVALIDEGKNPIAILTLNDIFSYDRSYRASQLFGTTDRNHPGVDAIYRRMGDTALGGSIQLLSRVDWGPFEKLRLEPKDTWRIFYDEKKFRSVAGFITGANPLHRGHEYIHKNALEEIDGLLIQPLVEMAKREYTRHEFRMLAYRSVLDTYYPKGRSILSPLRVTYIFAGPRETVLHALIMKNYGCTHALIGRDHAGIGEFYDKYASHTVFDEFDPKELGIDIRLFHEVFYCTRCSSPASSQSCPHDERYRINISGTGIREMLRHGIMPPKEIVRPESARIALQGIQPKGLDGNNESIQPVGKTINSMFPFYLERNSLGGRKRNKPLAIEDLTNRSLELVNIDVRLNADRIYRDIYNEYSSIGDINRNLQPTWVTEAREAIHEQQNLVIQDLKEKVQQAPEIASDEFMYQDKEEAERELKVAKKIKQDIAKPIHTKNLEYRGSDEPTED